MAEEFDSYNAPQFFDFTKDLYEEDDIDAYFEVDHENAVQDPLKFRASEVKQVMEPYCESEICENGESQKPLEPTKSEETPGKEFIDSPVISVDSNENLTSGKNLRRSISAGNLYRLYEEQPKLKNKKIINVSNALNTATSITSLDKYEAGSSRLTRGVSTDSLNRLAPPKRHHGSAQSLKQDNYVSMAESVRKFFNGTPTRFRSNPKLNRANVYTKPTATIPQSPALKTKQRCRTVNVISREEQEQLEYEEAQKFKIKAHPLNRKILQGPLKPQVPVEKKPLTIPEPFKITAPARKVAQSPKKEVFEFHAKPVPKTLHEPSKLKIEKINPTKPQTPTFMRKYSRETIQSQDIQKEDKTRFKPGRTAPAPFSFEDRDKSIQKRREEMLRKVLEEERKAREFHARPIPKAILHSMKHTSLRKSSSSDSIQSKGFSKSEESLSTQFKARPPTVLYKKPFEPKKEEKPLTEITEFVLNTELRAQERAEFEEFKKQKEERAALAKQLDEQMRLQKEREEVARLRKEAEHKAQPIKKYKELKIEPSGKVTEPISPKFHTNKYRNKENKEN